MIEFTGVSKSAHKPPREVPHKPAPQSDTTKRPRELGGPRGPEPTRYGDWERKGRCIDF